MSFRPPQRLVEPRPLKAELADLDAFVQTLGGKKPDQELTAAGDAKQAHEWRAAGEKPATKPQPAPPSLFKKHLRNIALGAALTLPAGYAVSRLVSSIAETQTSAHSEGTESYGLKVNDIRRMAAYDRILSNNSLLRDDQGLNTFLNTATSADRKEIQEIVKTYLQTHPRSFLTATELQNLTFWYKNERIGIDFDFYNAYVNTSVEQHLNIVDFVGDHPFIITNKGTGLFTRGLSHNPQPVLEALRQNPYAFNSFISFDKLAPVVRNFVRKNRFFASQHPQLIHDVLRSLKDAQK